MPWYVIVQRYSDSTNLFNQVDFIGPFETAEDAEAWTAKQGFDHYIHYTITTPSAPE